MRARAVRAAFAAALLAAAFAAAPCFAQGESPSDGVGDQSGVDDLFGEDSAIVEEAKTVSDPEADILENKGLAWGGGFESVLGARLSYADPEAFASDPAEGDEGLVASLDASLFFDARPDRRYRAYGKFGFSYPFGVAADSGTETVSFDKIKIVELFADWNWDDRLFLRVGKQTLAWGLSRFYQPADPISIGVKDPEKPELDLEGPLALKLSLPIGPHALYGVIVAKDSYFENGMKDASVADLGYGLKGEFLVVVPENPVFGNAEINVGAYWRRASAPKAVAGFSTGIGKVQVFSDQAVSWGLDAYRLTDEPDPAEPTVRATEKPDSGLFWSATLGFLYVDNDIHLTLYGEYFYNGSGSDDPDYLGLLVARYGAEQTPSSTLAKTIPVSELGAYQSRHNSSVNVSFSELFGSDKWSCSLLWQQNWTDASGMAIPRVAFEPFDHFAVAAGAVVSWGGDTDEFVAKTSDDGTPARLSAFVELSLGAGKF